MRFYAPTKIIFESGAISGLKDVVEADFRAKRLLLVTDKGIVRSGIAAKVFSQLPGTPVFDEVEQNPTQLTVNRGGAVARQRGSDLIIGLGGGSALDAAKGVALLATNPGGIEDYEGRSKYKTAPLPVIAIPTTCGTGSEVTWVAVITHTERKFKMGIKGPLMFPAVALVDPDLLSSLPRPLVAATALDALTHAVEAYTAKPATFMTDVWARESFGLVLRFIQDAYRDIGGNREAREGMMKGSLLAGLAFGNSDVGAVHCIAESIGALHDIPHGVANAVFLPFVMEFNLPVSSGRYAELARLTAIEEPDDALASRKLIQRIRELSRAMGIPSFQGLGLKEHQLAEIARKSFENNSSPSNPRVVTADDYLSILKKAFLEQ
jgi:alcohol dehydrogenase